MKTLIATVALSLTSLTSFAQEVTVFNDSYGTPKTRAEVRAELMAAIANGQRLSFGEIDAAPIAPMASTLTRAEVRAEVLRAIAGGERLFYGEVDPKSTGGAMVSRSHAIATGHDISAVR